MDATKAKDTPIQPGDALSLWICFGFIHEEVRSDI